MERCVEPRCGICLYDLSSERDHRLWFVSLHAGRRGFQLRDRVLDSILTCSDIQHIHSTSEGSILAILDVVLRYPRTVADGAAQNGFVGVLAVWNTVFNEQSLVRSGW